MPLVSLANFIRLVRQLNKYLEGVSLNESSKKIIGSILVLSVLISSYLVVLRIVSVFEVKGLLRSLNVRSSRDSNVAGVFVVDDTLILEVRSEWANAYGLQIYQEDSLIFEEDGDVYESMFY